MTKGSHLLRVLRIFHVLTTPKGKPMTENEFARVYNATIEMHADGVFPSPKALLTKLGLKATVDIRVGNKLVAGQRLNGTKSAARAQALVDLGYTKNYRTGRWER